MRSVISGCSRSSILPSSILFRFDFSSAVAAFAAAAGCDKEVAGGAAAAAAAPRPLPESSGGSAVAAASSSDISRCQFSCSGANVYIYLELCLIWDDFF